MSPAVHGAGLGLRRALLGPLEDQPEAQAGIDFLEVAPENWIGIGGRLGKRLREDAFKPGELEYDAASAETVSEDEAAPKVVRHKTFPVRPMSVEDAILQMELLGHSFFVFVNVETDRTNVLYLRKDGDLGLMEPEA